MASGASSNYLPEKRKREAVEEEAGDAAFGSQDLLVSGVQGAQLEASKLLGVLWEVDVFEGPEGVNRKATKKEIQTLVIGGEARRGVLRDPKYGRPMGSQDIWRRVFARAEQVADLSRSANQLREGETEDWFKHAKKQVALTTKHAEHEGAEYMIAKAAGSGKKRAVEDDDLGLLCCGTLA